MRVFIIEAPDPMDLLQARSEAAALERMCPLLGHEVAVFRVHSPPELAAICKFIASIDDAHAPRRQRHVPLCVHIASHGNEGGLGIGATTITWADLADTVLPLTSKMHQYSGPLILVLSACDAGEQSLTSELAERRKRKPNLRLPQYVFVTCDTRLMWAASVAAWTVFYHRMPSVDLEDRTTVRRMLTTVRAAGGAVIRYHRWDQAKGRYFKYEPAAET